jgi:hypothetical protein
VRGFLDALALAWSLLWQRSGFAAKYAAEVDRLQRDQFGWVDEVRGWTSTDEWDEDTRPKDRRR